MLTLRDLKTKGFQLSQSEAQELHSKVSGISLGHIPGGVIYAGTSEKELPKSDPLKEYYAELQQKNRELLKENADLLKKAETKPIKTQENTDMVQHINGVPDNTYAGSVVKNKPGRKPIVK